MSRITIIMLVKIDNNNKTGAIVILNSVNNNIRIANQDLLNQIVKWN